MARRKYPSPRKPGALLLTLVLLALALTGATLAYLITHTDPVPNRFTPAHVSCNVTEDFDGTTKKNVNVTNTGDIDAYLRVKLVTYRVNDDGQHIGGTAAIPASENISGRGRLSVRGVIRRGCTLSINRIGMSSTPRYLPS